VTFGCDSASYCRRFFGSPSTHWLPDFPDPDKPSLIEGGKANGLTEVMDLIEA